MAGKGKERGREREREKEIDREKEIEREREGARERNGKQSTQCAKAAKVFSFPLLSFFLSPSTLHLEGRGAARTLSLPL